MLYILGPRNRSRDLSQIVHGSTWFSHVLDVGCEAPPVQRRRMCRWESRFAQESTGKKKLTWASTTSTANLHQFISCQFLSSLLLTFAVLNNMQHFPRMSRENQLDPPQIHWVHEVPTSFTEMFHFNAAVMGFNSPALGHCNPCGVGKASTHHAWPCQKPFQSLCWLLLFWSQCPEIDSPHRSLFTEFAIYRDVATSKLPRFLELQLVPEKPKDPQLETSDVKIVKVRCLATLEMCWTVRGKVRFEATGWIQCYTHWMIWW